MKLTTIFQQHFVLLPLLRWITACHGFQTPLITKGWLDNQNTRTRSARTTCIAAVPLQASSKNEMENRTTRNVRRDFLLSSSAILLHTFNHPNQAMGIVTDETSSFANTKSDSAYSPQNLGSLSDSVNSSSSSPTPSSSTTSTEIEKKQSTDEIEINIPISKIQSSPLGIELADVEFRTNRRVYVKSIMPSSLAAQMGIQKNWVLVNVNGQSTERTNAKGAKQIIKSITSDNLILVFRDNSFEDQLQNLTANQEAVTQVAPAGDTTQRNQDGSIRIGVETSQQEQKMIVSQLVPPRMCRRGATTDDLLEISYIGRIVDTGEIFDGSAIMVNGKGVPGR